MIPFVRLCVESVMNSAHRVFLPRDEPSRAPPPPLIISSCMKFPLTILPFSVKSKMAPNMSETLFSLFGCPSMPVNWTYAAVGLERRKHLYSQILDHVDDYNGHVLGGVQIIINLPLFLCVEQNNLDFDFVSTAKALDFIESAEVFKSCTSKLMEDSMGDDNLIMQDDAEKFPSRFGDSHLRKDFKIADATVQFEKSADRSSPNSKQSLPLTSSSSRTFGFPFPIPKFNDDVPIWWSWFLRPNVLREIWTWPYKPFDLGQDTHSYLAFHGSTGLPLVSKTKEAFTADPALVVGPNLTKKFMDHAISPVLVGIWERESHYVIDKKNVNKQLSLANSPSSLTVLFHHDLGVFIRAGMKNEFENKNVNVVMKKNINHNFHMEESVAPCNALRVLDQHIFNDEADMKKMVDSLDVVDQETLDVSVTKNVNDDLDQCYENVEKNVKTNVAHHKNSDLVVDRFNDEKNAIVVMKETSVHHNEPGSNVSLGEHAAVKLSDVDQHGHNVQSDLLENLPDVSEDVIAKHLSSLVNHAKDMLSGLNPSLTDEEIFVKDLLFGSALTLAEEEHAKTNHVLPLVEVAKDSSGAALTLAQETVAKDMPSGLVPSLTEEQMVVKDLLSGTALNLAEEMVAKDMPGLDQKDLGPLKNFAHGFEIDLGMQEATNEKNTAGGPIFPTVAHGA